MEKSTLKKMINRGLTQAQIAAEVGKPKSSVIYWLKKHGLKTKGMSRSWTDEELVFAIKKSQSLAQAIKKLGLAANAGSYRTVRRRIKVLDIDTSHLVGKSVSGAARISDGDIFVRDSGYSDTSRLYKRLVRLGREERCEKCGLGPEWQREPMRLQVDHANGIRNDHRLENLRILCPNCHSQTKTWGSRNKK